MEKDAKTPLYGSRQRKMSVVKIERPEDLIRSSKSFQESRWLSEIDRDPDSKNLHRKYSDLLGYRNKLRFHHENKNRFLCGDASVYDNYSQSAGWIMKRASSFEYTRTTHWNHPLEQVRFTGEINNQEIYRKRSSPLPISSNYRSNLEAKHNIRQRTLTAYELFETSSASRRLGDIRHYQSEKFAKEREFTGVTLNGIENKSVRAYHQQKLPNLTSMPPWRNTYPDVAESVKEYFDQSDDKALNWNSCDLEELNDWENMLYRLFIYRTDNIIKKFEKYRLLLYSEILRRQTPQQK